MYLDTFIPKTGTWDIGTVQWDSRVLKEIRQYCNIEKINIKPGMRDYINTVAEKELVELRQISDKLNQYIIGMNELNRKSGSVKEVMTTYGATWDVFYDEFKNISSLSKKCFSKPDSFFQYILLKQIKGVKNE
jgi:hypothetical protein